MRQSNWLVLAFVIGGCTASETERAPDVIMAARSFELVRIGQASVSNRADVEARCDDRPFYGRYDLRDSTWTSVDSSLSPCPAGTARFARAVTASGYFRLRGDTIDLYVTDTRIGQQGLVQRGSIRGDSLVLWNSDLDGGNYAYSRRR